MKTLAALAAALGILIGTWTAQAEVRVAKPTWQERKLNELRNRVIRQSMELRVLRKRYRRDAFYAMRLASSMTGVRYSELRAVASCETGGTFSPLAKNSHSTAAGLLQFLDSTWRDQGMRGFSVYDPVANALAAARIVRREGWGQWQCSWAAK